MCRYPNPEILTPERNMSGLACGDVEVYRQFRDSQKESPEFGFDKALPSFYQSCASRWQIQEPGGSSEGPVLGHSILKWNLRTGKALYLVFWQSDATSIGIPHPEGYRHNERVALRRVVGPLSGDNPCKVHFEDLMTFRRLGTRKFAGIPPSPRNDKLIFA